MQNDKGIEINRRFFKALDQLIREKKVKSALEFCQGTGYHPTNLSRLKVEPHRAFPLHLLDLIVKEYDVSGDWLMAGIGRMKRKQSATPI